MRWIKLPLIHIKEIYIHIMQKMEKLKALETIKFSIMTHHGCWGECNYCAIAAHQGRTIRTRSEKYFK